MNSNIRCIEIQFGLQVMFALNCWIVTLDVLKSLSDLYQQTNDNCWIVTLDVLKYLDEDVLIPYENVE